MASLALSQLLLAMTLPLLELESTFVPTAQSELKLSSGNSGQQLDQNNGVGELGLVSSYVQLEFPNRTRPQELPENFILPAVWTFLHPRMLTALSLTTVCHVKHDGTRLCFCHSGYLWNATICSLYPTCHRSDRSEVDRSEVDLCKCRSFQGPASGYCQLLPPAPANLTLDSQLPKNTLNLLLKTAEATNLRWYLKHPDSHKHIFLRTGTNVFQTSSQGQAGLRVTRLSRYWTDGDTTCPEDFSVVAWNVTKAGFVAQAPCPVNKRGMIKRICGSDGIWGPIQNNCTEAKILSLCLEAQLLLEGQGKPDEEVPRILKQLQGQVGVASTPSDLREMLRTVTFLASVVAETRTELTGSALEDLLTTTDKILDGNISSLWTLAQAQEPSMGSDFLKAVETLVHSLSPQQHPFFFSSSNVLLQSQLLRHTSPPGYQMSFSAWPLLQARIPWHSLASLVHNGTNVSITSLVLQKLDHHLPSNYVQGLQSTPYTTPGLILVISITADGQAYTKADLIIDFEDMNGTLQCVFWDHRLYQSQGGWSDKGCRVHGANASTTTQCLCEHLTAFSILMSQHTVPENPILDLLSQVGLGASILALLVCLVIYRLVWGVVVRNKVAFFRHAALYNMVICLLAADTCFLGGPFIPSGYHSLFCLITAFLCHFFYLATFFWMLAQALVLAHQLLFVFHQLSKYWVLSLMVILGYLCPLGFAGVTLGLYLPQRRYLWEGKCLLNGDGVMLHAFSEPVLAIVTVNGLVLVIVVLKLLRPSLSEGPPTEKRQALVGVLKALLILTPIFGLTWGLGVVVLFDRDSVSHYIFTILNSLQGVFILVFGCLTDKKVLEALRKRFRDNQSSNSAISLLRRKDDWLTGTCDLLDIENEGQNSVSLGTVFSYKVLTNITALKIHKKVIF
ncbi:hypothetical protein STEG23_035877 [Scotinomys teguina]